MSNKQEVSPSNSNKQSKTEQSEQSHLGKFKLFYEHVDYQPASKSRIKRPRA